MRPNRWDVFAWRLRVSEATRWYVSLAIVSAVYLYLNLFASPGFPYLGGGDQVYFWMGALRILHGQAIYRDFFQLTPPGTDLVYAACFRLFGESIWVPNLVVLTVGVFSTCLCFTLSRRFMGNTAALLVSGVFLVAIYGKPLNATHHWFAVLLILTAVRVAMKSITTRSIVLTAVLLALATFFNHVHGMAALLGFIVFLLLWSKRLNLSPARIANIISTLILTFSLSLVCVGGYYFVTVGFERMWSCLVTSVFLYVTDNPRTLGLPAKLTSATLLQLSPYLAMYILLPVAYGLSLWRCWRWRKDPSFPWNEMLLLSLVGLTLLLEVAICVDWLRLFAISMPGIVLAGAAIREYRFLRRSLLVGTSIALISVASCQIVKKHFVFQAKGDLPGGKLSATPEVYRKLQWIADHTHPKELLFQAGWPSVYLPLQVQNPLYIPTLSRWDSMRAQNVKDAVQQMKTYQVRYVLWTHHLDEGCEFPMCNDYLSPFRAYLSASFKPIRRFSDGDVLWQTWK